MSNNKGFKIKFSEWGFAFLFIMYIPAFISRVIDIPHWWAFCHIVILLTDLLFLFRMKRINAFVLYTAMFYGYFTVTTLLFNTEETFNAIIRMYDAISFVILLEYLFFRYRSQKVTLILMRSMEVFNYTNLLSMLVHPNGIYRVQSNGIYEELVKVDGNYVRSASSRLLWLLGHQSMMIRFTLPAICIAVVICLQRYKKFKLNLRSLMLIIVCLMETFIANSAGNYIILALFLTLVVFFHFRGKIKAKYIYPLIIMVYALFITSTEELSLFTWMSGMMNRTVHISTRLPIWLNALNAWLQKPIFGWGYINEESDVIRKILWAGNPHSSYLWVLFEGGVIGLVLLIFYIQLVSKKMNGLWKSGIARVIYAALICILVGMIDDDYIFRYPQSLMIFSFVFHLPQFVEK